MQVRAEETDIYVGKGRYMKGDPKKYPTRNEWGVGGWAGGEAGLKKFLEENGVRCFLTLITHPLLCAHLYLCRCTGES